MNKINPAIRKKFDESETYLLIKYGYKYVINFNFD